MPYELRRDYDYTFEAATAIARLTSGEHPRAQREALLSRAFGAEAEKEIDECLGPMLVLYDALEKTLDLSDERVLFLFGRLPHVDGRLWELFVAPPAGIRCPEDPLRGFSWLLAQHGEALAIDTADALTARIVGTSLPLESKAKLLLACGEYAALDAFIQPYLARAEAFFRESLSPLAAVRDAALEALAAQQPASLAASCGIPLPVREDATYPLCPTFAAFDRVTLRSGCIYWGANVLPLFALKRRLDPLAQDKQLEVLRVLADKTKYDILRMLRTETLFGGQLAERTGLSPATISHHIAQLMSLGLVKAVKDGTRVYYALDRDLLGAYLRSIRASLLDG